MTPRQMRDFRKILEGVLNAAAREPVQRPPGLAVEQSADIFDRIGLEYDRELAYAELSRRSRLVGHVRAALDRIDQGVFGVCRRCGEAIPRKRLKAVPWAPFCIGCQEDADRRGMANAA